MFKFLAKLLNIHQHTWSKWYVVNTYTNGQGGARLIQARVCETCGKTQLSNEEV